MGVQLPTNLWVGPGFLVAINWCVPQDHHPAHDLDARSTVHDVRTRQVRLVARGGWKPTQDVLNPLQMVKPLRDLTKMKFLRIFLQLTSSPKKKSPKNFRLKSGRKLGW